MHDPLTDERFMARAMALSTRGLGFVEPNPMVGSVVVRGGQIIGEGWHRKFGGPHAEIEAIADAGVDARGGTLYVSLEPCCHTGKTPPCTAAIIEAGIARVVVAVGDPNPRVAGQGVAALQAAGIEVEIGIGGETGRQILAPYVKLVTTGRPWVIAKWAMTLDGKIAAATGDSQWITSEPARAIVHRLRGRVDAILVGCETAQRDDPLLTARPPGPRVAARIVADSSASLALESALARAANAAPVLVAASHAAPDERCRQLEAAGVEVLRLSGDDAASRLASLLDELGRREMTNLLVEGGGRLLGSLFDRRAIDEVHAFVAPKLIGGADAPSPIAGAGLERIADACRIDPPTYQIIGGDVYIHGRITA